MIKKSFSKEVLIPLLLIVYILYGIANGVHVVPGKDVHLSTEPNKFWLTTVFFLFVAIVATIAGILKVKKSK